MKFTVDAGHAGFKALKPKKVYATPGKRTPDGEPEWVFNDKVVKAYIKELSTYEDAQIKRVDDPTGKTDVSLNARTKIINDWDSDCHLSFHHNAFGNGSDYGSWTGVQTHVYESKPKEASALAKVVQQALVKAYGLRDRGIIYNDLHMTREPKMTSILLEGGFMDSRIDIKKLRDDDVLEAAGKSVAQAVAKFYKLEKKKEKVQVKQPAKQSETKAESYSVVKNISGYKTADDAKNKKKQASTVTKGSYYIYKKSGSMINVTKKKGSPGSWINPADNKADTTKYHVVQKDESVWELAQKYKTTVDKIAQLNKLKDPGKIYPGQKLRVK